MLNIQFVDLALLNTGDYTNLEFSCLLSVIDSLNDLYGYNEMLE